MSKLIKITLGLVSGITLAAAFNTDADASCVVTPPPPPSCVTCSGPRTGTSSLPPLSSYFQHQARCGAATYHPPYRPIVTSQASASASAYAGASGTSAASHASAGSYTGTSGGHASASAHASALAGHSSASAHASASSLSGGTQYAGASAYTGRTATLSPSYAASYAAATSSPSYSSSNAAATSSGYGTAAASASAYASSTGGSAYASASANAVVSSAYQSHQYRQEGFSGTYGGLGPNEFLHPTSCPISVHNPQGHQVAGCYKVVKRWTPPQIQRPAPHRTYYRVVRPIIYVRYPVPVCVTGPCAPQPYGRSRYGS